MKNLNALVIAMMAVLFLPFVSSAQDSAQKQVRLTIEKDDNGNISVMDTTIELSDLKNSGDWQNLKEFLGTDDFKSLGIDADKLDELENVYFFNSNDSEAGGTWSVSKNVEVGKDGEQTMEFIIKSGDDAEANSFTVTTEGNGTTWFFSDDGDSTSVFEQGDNTIVVKSKGAKEGSQTITLTNELVWTDIGSTQVDVETTEEGATIKLTREDGSIEEYKVDGKGTYLIDEEGNIEKVKGDADLDWNSKGNGLVWVTLGGEGDNSNVIVKRIDNNTSEINIDGREKQFIIESTDDENGESHVFVKSFDAGNGDKKVVIEKKVIVMKLDKSDKESLEKSGVEFNQKSDDLEVDNISFSPNPTTGKFTLAFDTMQEGKTKVNIYDAHGREVYHETISNFDGHFEKEIDISKENSGVYFLRIMQGKKLSTRKIVLE